jgi:sulfite reductase beta subunit-like hemoprotein
MIKSGGQLTRNEGLKSALPTLEGHIAPTLVDPAAERFSDDDYEFLKFHGIYQQDDRDLRKTGKKWIFMVRGRLPGGVVTQTSIWPSTTWPPGKRTTPCGSLPDRDSSFTAW